MPRRLALAAACLLTLLPVTFRSLASPPAALRGCLPEGRGIGPRHWLGCAADEGPRRELAGGERLLAGLTIDVNTATPEDLASVPGLSAKLAVAVVAERMRRGSFDSLDALIRVPGIGPVRLARARPHLAIGR